MARSFVKYRISTGPVLMKSGEVLTEADFEGMAMEAETTEPDMERLLNRARRGGGRPSLGEGISPVLQVRLDSETRDKLTARAEREHTTPSAVVRDAIKAWL